MNLRTVGTCVAALVIAVPLSAEPFTIRLATAFPDNSPWTDTLKRMGQELNRSTQNRVNLQVYSEAARTEQGLLARMKPQGGADAVTISIAGLAAVDDSVNAFGMPFFFASDAEAEFVVERLTPTIRRRLETKGYHLVNWGNGGWVRLFSVEPLRTLGDIKKARLYTSDDRALTWYKSQGFNAVMVPLADMHDQLKQRTITAAPSPPVYAVTIYQAVNYMLDVPLAPLLAATVVSNRAWANLSEADRASLLDVGARTQETIAGIAPSLDDRYIAKMRERSLRLVTLDKAELESLRAEAERIIPSQKDALVPADVYEEAIRARDAFRKTKKQARPGTIASGPVFHPRF